MKVGCLQCKHCQLGEQVLCQELAQHEGVPEQVHLTAAGLRNDGFGKEPKFRCFVAEQITADGSGECRNVIGYCLYYYTYATWVGQCCYMEDLYVKPDWRCKGVGTALMAEVTKAALAKECPRLQWSVLEWNKPAMDLYRHRGGIDITETEKRHLFRMSKPVMEQLVSESEG